MSMKTKITIILFLMLPVFTVNIIAQKVGTSSFQFLKVMPTARATAMADAYSSVSWGADAMFWNPSGLTGVENQEIISNMIFWIFNSKQTSLGYAVNLGEWGVAGANFQYVDYGLFEETSANPAYSYFNPDGSYNPGLTGRTFSPMAWVIGINFAKELTDKFSTGVGIKYAYESLYNGSDVTVVDPVKGAETYKTKTGVILFDFGIHYNTAFHSVQLGASVQNFGEQIKFAKESYPAPMNFRIGLSGNLIGKESLLLIDDVNRITMAYDIMQPNDYAQQMHFGLEYSFYERIALRAGYKLNYDVDRFTFGGGVNTSFAGFKFIFDYSFAQMGEYLGNVHRISLGVKL